MTMSTTNDCQRRSTFSLLSIWSLLHHQSHKSKLQKNKILITCNNFFFQNSFSVDSHLLNRVIYFFGNKINFDYKWSTKYLSGLVGKQINKQFTKQNIYRYQSLTGLLTAIRGFKHLLSSLFASTFASMAVSSTKNAFFQLQILSN